MKNENQIFATEDNSDELLCLYAHYEKTGGWEWLLTSEENELAFLQSLCEWAGHTWDPSDLD